MTIFPLGLHRPVEHAGIDRFLDLTGQSDGHLVAQRVTGDAR